MKRLLPLLLSISIPLLAQEQEKAQPDQLIEALMNAPDAASLNAAIETARKAGLPNQMFLEAQFIYLVNQNDQAGLADLAPTLEAQLPKYSSDDTMIFAVKEDFESIIHYTKALAALEKKDPALFKKHITEAFWLSPAHASQFAPHIHEVRMEEFMNKITLDLSRTFERQKKRNVKTSLKEVAGDSPAFLIHFWSPWVQPSILAMPEFTSIAEVLIKNKIPVTSLLLAGTDESRQDAADFLAADGSKIPGHWLIDTDKSALASTLRISSFPSVVLVNTDGRILFNGDPASRPLWEALATINPAIKKPTTNPVLPNITKDTPPTSGDEKK
ncbi:MAG: hypothetical protein OSB05_15065 [Akkermansiaceae bacterium]|nr:hypothetical protein [Akkermansiaceae bacterium]